MKASELRIGNIIQYSEDSVIFKVIGIHKYGLDVENDIETTYIELDQFEPIPLTEEWLLKFGFVKINHQMSLNDGSMTYHYELNGDDRHWQLYFNGRVFSINESQLLRHHLYHNQYLHQLQNLYFAVTGEELKMK